MPYTSNAELPSAVKKLATKLQTAFRKAFNAALKQYGNETSAFKVAWAQVNKMRESGSFHPTFLRVLRLFTQRYGDDVGREKFDSFVSKNGLNVGKNYHPNAQFNEALNEAYGWVGPFIQVMKEDKKAKWYAINALHAIVSLNNNDYTDIENMEDAAPTMNYRPLNYNHDHERWIPYPRTRVEYAKAEDMCIETIVRVDNRDAYLQKQLDHDPSIPEEEWINHPSIEGRPLIGGKTEGYHFTAMALLEKGYQLPGNPLSEITPILFEGVQGGEVCLIVDGERVCLECDESLKEGQNMKELNIDEINQGGAKCPNCGLLANIDGMNDVSEIECPNCGTAFEARPEKTVEKTVEKASTANKLISPEESNISMTSSAEDTSKPNQELADAALKKEADDKLKQKTEDALKEKADNLKQKADEALKLAESMNTSELKVEIAKLNADLAYKTADLTELETKLRDLKKESTKNANGARDQIQDLSTKLASKIREVATLEYLKSRVTEATQEIGEKKGEIDDLKIQISILEESIISRDTKISGLEQDHTTLRADYEKLRMQHEDVRKDRNDLSVKTKTAEEKALNETRERSRIELDNADLLDKQRELTADISKLSERIALGANNKLDQGKELAKLQTEILELKESHRVKRESFNSKLDEAKKFHSWAWSKLKEAGYAIVEE